MGPKHPEVFKARNDLGIFLIDEQRNAEARQLYAQLHDDALAVFGADNFNVAVFDVSYAQALADTGEPARALALVEPAIPRLLKMLRPDHPRVLKAQALLERLTAGGRS